MSKKAIKTGLVLGTITSLLGAAYYWLVRRPMARTRGQLKLPGLRAPAEVLRDRWGVPHIYAQNTRDVMFVQGFVHAQDRLWQMDYNRRLVSGRLAEIFGEVAVPLDRWVRILGMRRAGERDVELMDDHLRRSLEAYAAGVNARIAMGRLPLEFSLLRYHPEPWTIADSISWGKMMSWSLSVNWEAELLRSHLIHKLGPELAAELEPAPLPRWPTVMPPGFDYSELGETALKRAGAARPFIGPGPSNGLGSNNWVVSGGHTLSGSPLLANDMHLLLSIPAIWYENHLEGGDLKVAGVTFPGVPGVVSGHNERVAWGFTNSFADVQDLYLEHLRKTENGTVQYEFKGQWLDAMVINEEIHVRDGEDLIEHVVITQHGPIINALSPDFCGEQPLALRWTSLEPERIMLAFYNMNRASDCLEFRDALRYFSSPSQNVVYADVDENIGYTLAGRVPVRDKGEGQLPVPGWTGEYEWRGYIDFEELPHLYNPDQGYIITANNRIAPEGYSHFLGHDFVMGDRAERIQEVLGSRSKVDRAYIQQMQIDQVSPSARSIARLLGDMQVDDVDLQAIVDLMRAWDGHVAADSPAAAVYEVFILRLIELLLEGKLGDLTERVIGKGPTPVLAELSVFSQHIWEWLHRILSQPQSHWFDLGGGEDRDAVMRIALKETLDFLNTEIGPMPQWAWGELHRLTFDHPLSHIRPLENMLNRGPYPVGGDHNTIWQMGVAKAKLQTESIIGPPYRFVADLGDLRNSVSVLAPGESGQPDNHHYADQIEPWFQGSYHPMLFARSDVEAYLEDKLRLLPAEP